MDGESKIPDKEIAILIPCYNEANTVVQVISDFKRVFQNAKIYVYDNNSTDNTAGMALNAGAIVRFVHKRGKGNVIRKMFADVDADVYIMVDGDATYTAADSIKMLQVMEKDKSDMVVAVRKAKTEAAYPMFHVFGNSLFNFIMKLLFGGEFHDVFSGFRMFSKRFVKTFPVTTNGFDIEAELSIHALTLSIPYSEVESLYLERKQNSYSKLHTIKDGIHILISILRLFIDNKPLYLFGGISMFLLICAGFLYPTETLPARTCVSYSVLSIAAVIVSIISLCCGLNLRAISKIQLEVKRLLYLSK